MDRNADLPLAPPESPRRSPAVTFILVTMLLDWLVVGIASPVVPKVIVDFLHGDVSRASAISGAFGTAFAFVSFFASPIMGVLSDRFGRRPIILLSTLGSAVECLILALAPDLWWLLVGRVMSGTTAAGVTTGAAYIADVTPPERRAAAFGLAGAVFGIGFTLGPAVGGLLANLGLRVPFFACAGLMLASSIYGAFVLPESLPPAQRQRRIAWERSNPLGSLKLVRRHADLWRFVLSLFCSELAAQSFSVFVLYTIERFRWSETAIGLGLSLFGTISVVASVVVGKLVARFGAEAVVIAGFGLGALGFVVYGSATSGAIFACALPLTGVWVIADPPIQSRMSRRVSESEQGELQGALGSMRSISMIVGPLSFSLIFALVSVHASAPLIGAPWFCGALLLVAATIFSQQAMRQPAPSAELPAA